jgi:hypothetical protein
MKHQFLTLALLITVSASAFAQNQTATSSESRKLATYEPGRRAQSVFFEVLGAGGTYSFNYDTRFQNTLNGLGGRVGVSYLAVDGNGLFTAPVMLNYLLGKNGKYFEMGLGATYVGFNANDRGQNDEVLFIDSDGFFGTMNFGYRKQPVDGGFMFRAGVTPIFNKNNFIPYYGYISFGYSF